MLAAPNLPPRGRFAQNLKFLAAVTMSRWVNSARGTMTFRTPLTALLAVLSVFALAPAASAADGTVDIIVRRDAGLSAAEKVEVRADAGVAFERKMLLPDTEVVTVAADEADKALATLNADPDVRYAERDGVVSAASSPPPPPPFRVPVSDPWLKDLYAIQNTGQYLSTGSPAKNDADMDLREAWNLAQGAGVTVAVVDTGVLMTHPDFAGQLATTADIPANGVDDDANGFIDDSNGWDFVREDNDPSLEDGDNAHGTHVAGTIAAAKNDIFTVGAAPQAKVLPLRVLNGPGATGNWSDITDAFVYAGKMGIPIVNASLGGGGVVESVRDAVALYPNTLYVVAAGNNGRWLNPDFVYYPCDAPSGNVMCVGATESTDTKASFSNFSKVSVDVFAPGQGIVSLWPTNGGIAFKSGTSMATPNVAGAAALVISAGGAQRGQALKQLIMDTVDTPAALKDLAVTSGRVNALAAVKAVRPDRDDDGVADAQDVSPDTWGSHTDGSLDDVDSDSFDAALDNCPEVHNVDQADDDEDGIGNACDPTPRGVDADADGVGLMDDNCPAVANTDQRDTDKDGVGDACDPTPNGPDADLDRVLDSTDNCTWTRNADQRDADGDGLGDACDFTPRGPDADGDGVGALDDTCPALYGPASNGGCPLPPTPDTGTGAGGGGNTDPGTGTGIGGGGGSTGGGGDTVTQPAPRLSAAKVVKGRTPKLTVRSDRAATVKVLVQRKVHSKGRWVYKTVATKTVKAKAGDTASVKLGRLSRGTYKLRVTAAAAKTTSKAKTVNFSVR